MGIRAVVRGQLNARLDSVANPAGVEVEESEPRGLIRWLDERFPQLSQWLGGRLEIELPALAVSVGVHAVFLLILATAGYAVHRERQREFQTQVVDTSIANELNAKVEFQDLDMGDKPLTQTPAAGSFAPQLAPMTVTPPPAAGSGAAKNVATPPSNNPSAPQLASLDITRASSVAVPSASMLGQNVSIKGSGLEHSDNVEGAVDRLAEEVLRHLEKGRTLVVWAFDASGSLQVERERLSKHIETVYKHINQLDGKDLSQDGGLLTSVVAFGHDRKAMTTAPTGNTEEIIEAINAVPLDTTGVETTFGTVAEIVHRWGRFKDKQGNAYHTMVIVVTDEVGDDESRLEEAIEVASRAKVPVYVLGSQALFGRVDGYMNYTDPKTKHTFYGVPVRQGPESVALEQIKLPFWYDGYQYDMLDSGFGPYALSRMARATGGIYFLARMGSERMGFDPVRMREYSPDWVSRAQYESALSKNPIRQAVLAAAQLTQQRMGPQPSLTFPSMDGPEFKEVMADNQIKVALTASVVDEALGPIMQAAKYRDKEPSRRWQAHYDLIRGRLLAMKIRCYEYNWACAMMKKDAPKFQNANSNAWKLVPSVEVRYSDKAAAAAKQAKDLLKRVISEHPNTPWALLAQRELKDEFGFQWVETYVKPIERSKESDAAREEKKKKMMNMPKPPEPPKL